MTARHKGSGFTIIEVMIVLAIVALMLLIVFLAVPMLQRTERNNHRKFAADEVAAEMSDYYAAHGHLPTSNADGNDFVNHNLVNVTNQFDVEFYGISAPHSYVPPYDQIAVQYAHWCNKYGDGENDTDPIAGNDENKHLFVVWTNLENGGDGTIYCVDNHS